VSNGKTLLMISKVGIAVKAGAAKPDISTPDHLKAALLAAKTVGYSQGASGRHFLTVIEKLGIADAVKAKAVIAQGRPVGAAIASGEAEIGVQQVAELRPVPGTEVIGEMPAALQKLIPYSAGIVAKGKDQEGARPLVSFLRSEPALDVLKRKGMDVPRYCGLGHRGPLGAARVRISKQMSGWVGVACQSLVPALQRSQGIGRKGPKLRSSALAAMLTITVATP